MNSVTSELVNRFKIHDHFPCLFFDFCGINTLYYSLFSCKRPQMNFKNGLSFALLSFGIISVLLNSASMAADKDSNQFRTQWSFGRATVEASLVVQRPHNGRFVWTSPEFCVIQTSGKSVIDKSNGSCRAYFFPDSTKISPYSKDMEILLSQQTFCLSVKQRKKISKEKKGIDELIESKSLDAIDAYIANIPTKTTADKSSSLKASSDDGDQESFPIAVRDVTMLPAKVPAFLSVLQISRTAEDENSSSSVVTSELYKYPREFYPVAGYYAVGNLDATQFRLLSSDKTILVPSAGYMVIVP